MSKLFPHDNRELWEYKMSKLFSADNRELWGCEKCVFAGRRKVLGEGNLETASLVIIGQAPGLHEDREGRPFVGPAGKLIFQTLESLGIRRSDCYVTNVVKCFPGREGTGDAVPDSKTRSLCRQVFSDEWNKIQGKVILLLGNVAIRDFLKTKGSAVWGKVLTDDKQNLILAVRHPATFLYHDSAEARLSWMQQLRILPSLLKVKQGGAGRDRVSFLISRTPSEVEEAVDFFQNEPLVAFDLETTTIHPYDVGADILAVALSSGRRTVVIPTSGLTQNTPQIASLRRFFENESIGKVGHNVKFDLVWLLGFWGIEVKNLAFDTCVAQYLLNEGTGATVSLKALAWKYFPQLAGYEEGIDSQAMGDVSEEKMIEYTATDAFLTFKIAQLLEPRIKEAGYSFVLRTILLPALYPLTEMEVFGLKVDLKRVEAERAKVEEKLKAVERQLMELETIRSIPGFKINSSLSLKKLFSERLGLRSGHLTAKKGEERLTKEELEKWASEGIKEAELILEYRRLLKVLNTYYENFIELRKRDGCVHPVYNVALAKGGRLTSGSPNIQNVPKTERAIFVPRYDGWFIVQADFKQIEMRVMACVSRDSNLISIFKSGVDPHAETAARILGKPVEAVTPEERSRAKAVNFGLFYGMRPASLAERERISLQEAEQFFNGFFRSFSGVRRWQERQRLRLQKTDVVTSPFGRRRNLGAYVGEEKIKRAYNFPIQSTASDINLYMMGTLWRKMKQLGLKSKFIATVHDSIVLEVPGSEVETVRSLLLQVSESIPDFLKMAGRIVKVEDGFVEGSIVPFPIDIGVGATWADVG